jgi:hypothetical protein
MIYIVNFTDNANYDIKKPEKYPIGYPAKNHAGQPWKIASYSDDIAEITINMSAAAADFED